MKRRAKGPDLAEYFDSISHNLNGPKPIFLGQIDETVSLLANNLDFAKGLPSIRMMVLSFSSLRASVVLCQAGLTSQVPSVVRHALEAAFYAYLFRRDEHFAELWLKRENDSKAKEKFRREALPRAKALLRQENETFCNTASQQIDFLISFGAHPNVFQLVDLVRTVVYDDGNGGYEELALIPPPESRHDAYLQIVSTYANVAEFYGLLWPERFALLNGREKMAYGYSLFRQYRDVQAGTHSKQA